MKTILLFISLLSLTFVYSQRLPLSDLEVNDNVYSLNGNPYTGNIYELYDSGQLESEYEVKDGQKHGIENIYFVDNSYSNDSYKDTSVIRAQKYHIALHEKEMAKGQNDSTVFTLNKSKHLDTLTLTSINWKKLKKLEYEKDALTKKYSDESLHDDPFSKRGVEIGRKITFNANKIEEVRAGQFITLKEYQNKYNLDKLKHSKIILYKKYLTVDKTLNETVVNLLNIRNKIDSLKNNIEGEYHKPFYENQIEEIYTYHEGNQTGLHQKYDESKIVLLEEELKDGVRNGSYKRYENGKTKERGTYLNNKKNGKWSFYNQDILFEIVNFKDGEKSGLYKKYNKSGDQIISVGVFQDDRKVGIWKNNDDNGELIELSTYKNDTLHGLYQKYSSDVVIKEGGYQNGLRGGEWKESDGNGQLSLLSNYTSDTLNGLYKKYKGDVIIEEGQYTSGLMNGEWVFRYDNGKKKGEVKFVNGDGTNVDNETNIPYSGRDGFHQEWHANGNLKLTKTYVNGKVHGEMKGYYENGKIRSEGNYVNGTETGKSYVYHENGNLKELYMNVKDGNPFYVGSIKKLYDSHGKFQKEVFYDGVMWKTKEEAEQQQAEYSKKQIPIRYDEFNSPIQVLEFLEAEVFVNYDKTLALLFSGTSNTSKYWLLFTDLKKFKGSRFDKSFLVSICDGKPFSCYYTRDWDQLKLEDIKVFGSDYAKLYFRNIGGNRTMVLTLNTNGKLTGWDHLDQGEGSLMLRDDFDW
ncbi:hypothetical protein OAV26_00280 [Crocinitomicaceae bacterium]|nr:hypothetical protein [Crocinitomicaceae bacterium]